MGDKRCCWLERGAHIEQHKRGSQKGEYCHARLKRYIRLTGHRVRLPSAEWRGKAQSDYIFLDKACTMKLDKMSHQLHFLQVNTVFQDSAREA